LTRARSAWKGVALLVLLVGGVWGWRARTSARDVETVALETRDVRSTLVVAGRVRAPSTVALGSTVSGVVQAVDVEEGARVPEGMVLVRLDDRELRAAAAEAQWRLADIEASASDASRRAALEVEQSERELERVRAVVLAGGLTVQRLEQAEQRAAEARSRLLALEAGRGDDGTPAPVRTARSALEGARARLAGASVVAPFPGVVLERLVEPGDAVQAGAPLLSFAKDGDMEVEVFPAEENLGRIRVGAPAVMSADAFPEVVYPGAVRSVAPAVDPASGTVAVRLSVESTQGSLRPGMTMSVNLETGRVSGARVLPASAVRGLGTGEPWVALVRAGRVERRLVEVGLRAGDHVEILSGLEAGDGVVLRADAVEPGVRVRLRPAG